MPSGFVFEVEFRQPIKEIRSKPSPSSTATPESSKDKQNDDIHTFDGAREMRVLWNKVHGAMLAVRCECEMVPLIDPVEQVVV